MRWILRRMRMEQSCSRVLGRGVFIAFETVEYSVNVASVHNGSFEVAACDCHLKNHENGAALLT
jgi:hypothetical protein